MFNPNCKCGKKMNAVIFGYLPVPEGHYVGSKIYLVCPACKSCRVEYSYLNSSFDYDAFEALRLPTQLNDRVNGAVLELCNLVWDYKRSPSQSLISIIVISRKLESLQAKDFPILLAELNMLALQSYSSLGKVCFDPMAEIMSAAQSDCQFGQMSDGMADWYDNEARSASREPAPEKRVIDTVIELVKMIEQSTIR